MIKPPKAEVISEDALTQRIVKKPHKKGSIPIDVIKQAVKNAMNARDNG